MEKCWLCPRVFQNKSDLNAHLVSREHRRQSVICPWCGDEKTFTRVSDLSVHCSNRHFIEINSLPKSFLTARNCFYFSIFPKDYAKIHQPEKWTSSNAIEARRLVIKMLEKQKDSQIKRDNWRSGWREAVKQDQENKENQNTSLNKSIVSDNYEEPVNLIDKKEKKETVRKIAEQKSKSKERKMNLKEANEQCIPLDLTKKIESSQSNKRRAKELPDTVDMKVRKVYGGSKERGGNDEDKQEEVKGNSKSENKKFQNDEISENFYENGKEKCEEGSIHKVLDDRKINDGDGAVNDVKRCNESEGAGIDEKSCEVSCDVTSDEKKKSVDGELSEVIDEEKKSRENSNIEKRKEDAEVEMRIVGEKCEGKSGFEKSENDVVKVKSEKAAEIEVKEEKDKESKGNFEDIVSESDEVYTATKLIIDEMDREDQEVQEFSELKEEEKLNAGKPKRETIWKRSNDGFLRRVFKKETPRKEKEEHETNNVKAEENKDVKELNFDMNNNEYFETDYKQKAKDILKTGAMPLVPPGRREWKGACTFRINLFGCDFTWPPMNWQQMTPDRKLMAWEHTAFQLEYLQNGIISPSMSRSFLLDKYNFLALPGSGKVKKEEHEKGAARARFYLYQMLREAANGKYPSEAEKAQIDTLGLIQNKGELQRQLASLDIPLRLAAGKDEP